HFIYTSAEVNEADESAIADRGVKVRLEKYTRATCDTHGIRWTILRPGFFLQNFTIKTLGPITVSVLKNGLSAGTKLQVVDGEDAGRMAFVVFENSEKHAGQTLSIFGESVTVLEFMAKYKQGAGRDISSSPDFLGKLILAMNAQTRKLHGFRV
ncbi:NAD(P)-binding protein, partial [Exidia glandulosa HHB12029]